MIQETICFIEDLSINGELTDRVALQTISILQTLDEISNGEFRKPAYHTESPEEIWLAWETDEYYLVLEVFHNKDASIRYTSREES